MKIMVIDDSRTMRMLIKQVLEQLGERDVVEASDGMDAMSKLAAESPELILVDWNMPNMDGLTFVDKVRRQGLKAPIIMVTTEGEKSRVVDAIKAGVNDYVVKPFTAEVLRDRVAGVIKKLAAAVA